MFFGLPDLHPDPLVTSTDTAPNPVPDPCIIKQIQQENLDFYWFVTSLFCYCSGSAGSLCFWASRIRIQIRQTEIRIRESEYVPKLHGSTTLLTSKSTVRDIISSTHFVFILYLILETSVEDPESDPDPVGSETFCRFRSRIRNESFRIRIRAALARNEVEKNFPDRIHYFSTK